MVGYLMVIYDYDEESYNVWHLMIDAAFQGRGFGRAALEKALEYIAQKPFGSSDRVLMTCAAENAVACGLYHRLGFTETGRSDGEEAELSLPLGQ